MTGIDCFGSLDSDDIEDLKARNRDPDMEVTVRVKYVRCRHASSRAQRGCARCQGFGQRLVKSC